MNPTLLDPNNHVPEVSPDDGWSDAEGCGSATKAGSTTVLPPRRIVADRSAAETVAAVESGNIGLRIGSNLVRGEFAESPQRLEVQEINGAVVRLEQTAPAPPKVLRQLTFHERPPREAVDKRSPDESLQWGLARRRPTHWILGAGVAVAMIVVLALMVLPAINAPNAPRPVPDAAPFVEEKFENIEAMNLLLVKQSEAIRIFRGYVAATRAEEVVPMLRDGTTLQETLQSNWQPLKISKEWEPASDSTWAVVDIPGQPCGLLQGTFPDQSKFSAFFTSDGARLQLDWKATAGFGTATFMQLANGQGDTREIRGEISCADYYSGIFPEADYQSYRLISPDGESYIWCYARRGEPADDSIAQLLQRAETGGELKSSSRITLRLESGPSGALPNQWLIGEMLHIDWVTP
ncbi:MAG: hypothetical protein V4819_14495 [Verrucomicrobiota bacterium]